MGKSNLFLHNFDKLLLPLLNCAVDINETGVENKLKSALLVVTFKR